MTTTVRGRPFAKGFDVRRHTLSKAECRKGFMVATRQARMPSRVRAWLRSKIRGYYINRIGVRKGGAA